MPGIAYHMWLEYKDKERDAGGMRSDFYGDESPVVESQKP